jgi:hypothetical protein
MRVVVFLGVLFISVSHAFAADSSLDTYCGPTSPPQVCSEYIDGFLAEHQRFKDASAENHPVLDFCFTTTDPPGCIVSFRTNRPEAYAREIARMEQQIAQEEARLKTLLKKQAQFEEQAQFERRYQAERQQEGHEPVDKPVIPMPITPIVQPSSPLNPVR